MPRVASWSLISSSSSSPFLVLIKVSAGRAGLASSTLLGEPILTSCRGSVSILTLRSTGLGWRKQLHERDGSGSCLQVLGAQTSPDGAGHQERASRGSLQSRGAQEEPNKAEGGERMGREKLRMEQKLCSSRSCVIAAGLCGSGLSACLCHHI